MRESDANIYVLIACTVEAWDITEEHLQEECRDITLKESNVC